MVSKWKYVICERRGKPMTNKLKVFRASRNLSGEDMAKILNVTSTAYYNLENGSTDIKIKHIRMIRDAFNLSVSEILDLFNL